MIYRENSPYFSFYIDDYKTKDYAQTENLHCRNCGRIINVDEEYFDIDDNIYCLRCSEYADKCILEAVRDDYIYIY